MKRNAMRARQLRDDAFTLRAAARIMRRHKANTEPASMAAFTRRLVDQAVHLDREAHLLDPPEVD